MQTRTATPLPALSAHTALLPADLPAEGTWLQLLPAGEVTGRDGRGPYLVGDEADMRQIVDATLKRTKATDLFVDYDHQAVFGAIPNVGGNAPAAGWIKELQVRPDGIWGRVEWTSAATEKIRAKEYRYLSPVFFNDASGRIRWIFNAGLINTPNFELEAVAASDRSLSIQEHDMKRIAAELGLGETATEDDIVAAVRTMKSAHSTVAAAVGLQAQATADAITAAIAAKAPDPAKFVPIEQYNAVQSSLADLQKSGSMAKVDAAVAGAIAAGKVAPASKDWALSYASQDFAGFESFVKTAPVIVSPQAQNPHSERKPTVGAADLDATDLQVQSQMGISKEAFVKAREQEAR